MQERKRWKTVIDSGSSRLEFKLREVWQYRDLVILFVKRNFISKYKQMILGPLWAIVNPLLTTVVFTVVFGNLAKLPTMDSVPGGNAVVPSFLFYMIGNILWHYFAGTVRETANTFIQNANIMGKVYYPRLVTPISTAGAGLITLAIQLLLFVILLVVSVLRKNAVIHPSVPLLLFPLLIFQLMLLGLGVGLTISAVTTKYRDMLMLVDFGLQLWLYTTPVAYGLQLVPEKWMNLYMLNPMTSIVVTARYLCFGEGYFKLSYFCQSWIMSVLIFLLGILLFNRIEKDFIDTI